MKRDSNLGRMLLSLSLLVLASGCCHHRRKRMPDTVVPLLRDTAAQYVDMLCADAGERDAVFALVLFHMRETTSGMLLDRDRDRDQDRDRDRERERERDRDRDRDRDRETIVQLRCRETQMSCAGAAPYTSFQNDTEGAPPTLRCVWEMRHRDCRSNWRGQQVSHPPACLPLCLSACLSVCLPVCLCLSLCLSLSASLCALLNDSVCLTTHLTFMRYKDY